MKRTKENYEKRMLELAQSDERLKISLTNDFAFKKTFHNKKALKGLISAFLEIPPEAINEIVFMDPLLAGEYPQEKEGILDLKIHLNGDRKINIEMQVLNFPAWQERTLFYLSKMFVEDFQKGENYGDLEQCIHISILKFNIYENPPLYSVIELWDRENGIRYSDKLSLRVLQFIRKVSDSEQKEKEQSIQKIKLL